MHECPDCGQACCCDGEDTWLESNSGSCECDCWNDKLESGDDDFYDEEGVTDAE